MTISAQMRAEMYKQATSEAFIPLLTIAHDDIEDGPLRFAANEVDIESRGNTFIGFAFRLTLPADDPEQPPMAKLRIDNVDQRIVQAVRAITSAPIVTIECIRSSDPDTVEVSITDLELAQVSYNAFEVSGDLTFENILLEPYPSATFDPARFRGGY